MSEQQETVETTIIYVGTQADPEKRARLTVPLSEYTPLLIGEVESAWVTDVESGAKYHVEPADCGLSCKCALDFVPGSPRPPKAGGKIRNPKYLRGGAAPLQ
jgi:hypothetical protein